jgi:hypothetical protein
MQIVWQQSEWNRATPVISSPLQSAIVRHSIVVFLSQGFAL